MPLVESSILNYLLFCDHSPSFDDFSILADGAIKLLLEIKERKLIKRDKPELNKNISFDPLFSFDTVQYDWSCIYCLIWHGVYLNRCKIFVNIAHIW